MILLAAVPWYSAQTRAGSRMDGVHWLPTPTHCPTLPVPVDGEPRLPWMVASGRSGSWGALPGSCQGGKVCNQIWMMSVTSMEGVNCHAELASKIARLELLTSRPLAVALLFAEPRIAHWVIAGHQLSHLWLPLADVLSVGAPTLLGLVTECNDPAHWCNSPSWGCHWLNPGRDGEGLLCQHCCGWVLHDVLCDGCRMAGKWH
jgi:hypothetical protein